MSPLRHTPRPPIGEDLHAEQSEIRSRAHATIIPPPREDCAEAPERGPSLARATPDDRDTDPITETRLVHERSRSLDANLALAKALLAALPIHHRRAQLLRLAMLRRDHVLLEALLANLGL